MKILAQISSLLCPKCGYKLALKENALSVFLTCETYYDSNGNICEYYGEKFKLPNVIELERIENDKIFRN